MQRIPRLLDDAEVRVLGALLEKEMTTPEIYPLSVNALVQACNQKTARDPVMQLTEAGVHWALRLLLNEGLVSRTDGARVSRWKQNVDARWDLDGGRKAVLGLLLLRGPQTPGELRSRSDRMHAFGTLSELEEALTALTFPPEPLVVELRRAPGQKEKRFAHLLQEPPEIAVPDQAKSSYVEADRRPGTPSLESRVQDLDERVKDLEERLAALTRRDGEAPPRVESGPNSAP